MASNSQGSFTPQQSLEEQLGINLPELPDEEIRLPIGMCVDGKVIRTAKIRAMKGPDREWATGVKNRKSPAHMTTALLSRCVTHLGHITNVTPDHVRRLTEADRTYLSMLIRRKTYNDDFIDVAGRCDGPDGCGHITHDSIDTKTVDVVYIDEIEWKDDYPCFRVKHDEMNIEATVRYLLGSDLEKISVMYGGKGLDAINPIEAQNIQIGMMVLDINGNELKDDMYRNLNPIVQKVFEEAVLGINVGPDFGVHAKCEECGRPIEINVNIVDFLSGARRRKD